ncbi:hypothetical protein E3A20_27850, partial [Planctomyces bekefii]
MKKMKKKMKNKEDLKKIKSIGEEMYDTEEM